MNYSLCDQYWNRNDNFENMKNSVLFILVNMQDTCKKYTVVILLYLFLIMFVIKK